MIVEKPLEITLRRCDQIIEAHPTPTPRPILLCPFDTTKNMKTLSILTMYLLLSVGHDAPAATIHAVTCLEDCNLTWNSPSADSFGSMPLGNGDVARTCGSNPTATCSSM